MLQGQRDLATVSNMILSELAPLVSAQHGVFYALTDPGDGGKPALAVPGRVRLKERKHLGNSFQLGEGLVGQCALEKERILLTDVPARLHTDQLRPGRVAAAEHHRPADPLRGIGPGRDRAGLLLAFSDAHQSLLDQLTESIGLVLNTVDATSVTEKLLEQSQSQALELQSRQEELHQSNEDLAEQAALLADKNSR